MSPFRGKLFEKVGRLARDAEVMREHISIGCKVFADLVLSHKLL